jgi:hypothetical protein
MERFPAVIKRDTADRNMEIAAKQNYNALLQQHFDVFQANHTGIMSSLINVDSAFDVVLDNPLRFGAPNATCENTDGTSCLWRDDLHAGVQIHNQVARKIADSLGSDFFFEVSN